MSGRLTIIGGGVMGHIGIYGHPVYEGKTPGVKIGFYKFAPWVGRVLAQLALQQGTVYDIGRFTPARFAAEGVAS